MLTVWRYYYYYYYYSEIRNMTQRLVHGQIPLNAVFTLTRNGCVHKSPRYHAALRTNLTESTAVISFRSACCVTSRACLKTSHKSHHRLWPKPYTGTGRWFRHKGMSRPPPVSVEETMETDSESKFFATIQMPKHQLIIIWLCWRTGLEACCCILFWYWKSTC